MNKSIFIALITSLIVVTFFIITPFEKWAEKMCAKYNGAWDNEECIWVDKQTCEDKLQGVFEECASPCRHDPNAEVCILSCEQVCQFKN